MGGLVMASTWGVGLKYCNLVQYKTRWTSTQGCKNSVDQDTACTAGKMLSFDGVSRHDRGRQLSESNKRAVRFREFLVRPRLDNASLIENHDTIGSHNR